MKKISNRIFGLFLCTGALLSIESCSLIGLGIGGIIDKNLSHQDTVSIFPNSNNYSGDAIIKYKDSSGYIVFAGYSEESGDSYIERYAFWENKEPAGKPMIQPHDSVMLIDDDGLIWRFTNFF